MNLKECKTPREAAEKIVDYYFAERQGKAAHLLEAITTAIQLFSNHELERGRAKLADKDAQILILKEEIQRIDKDRDALLKEVSQYQAAESRLLASVDLWRSMAVRHDHGCHVGLFMQKFQQHIGDTPGWPPQEVMDLRVKLMAEEFAEMLEAGGYAGNFWIGRSTPESREHASYITHWHHHPVDVGRTVDFPAFIDALLDIEYVTLGTHVSCGVDPQPIWEAVHAANMQKMPVGAKGAVKPEGWTPPDVAGELRKQGWQG